MRPARIGRRRTGAKAVVRRDTPRVKVGGMPTALTAPAAQIAALATRQDGLVDVHQLREAGLSPATIRRWVVRGHLHQRHQGVYAVGHAAPSLRATFRAALLACGREAALSHLSAAAWRGYVRRPGALPHVTVPRRGGRGRPRIVIHRVRRLADEDVTVVDGLRCTTPERTLLDLAEVLPLPDLRSALREATLRNDFDMARMQATLERAVGRRGLRPMRAVLRDHDAAWGRAASHPEIDFLRFCAVQGLPAPVINARLHVAGRWLEADTLWPDARLVVEVDGRDVHGLPEAFEADRRKDGDLRDAGFDVRRVTRARLIDDADGLAAQLRRALARGRALGPPGTVPADHVPRRLPPAPTRGHR
jgi:hypothetical protein